MKFPDRFFFFVALLLSLSTSATTGENRPDIILIMGDDIGISDIGCSSQNESEGDKSADKPNIILIFADDLGYGDLSCYGHPTIQTPNLDKLAFEGQVWTNFYVAASVCTPSRAGLMTGRYPIRSGMCSGKRRVLFPDSSSGIPEEEITLAEQLKKAGYATAAIGKWHLGHHTAYLPTNNGFDSYFGIPYSNDMARKTPEGISYIEACKDAKSEYFQVPIMENEEVYELPANQNTLTKRYNERAVNYVRENSDKPFFLYLAHSLPHVPLFVSDDFKNTSKRGLYGDVLAEIDYGVGQIISALRDEGIEDNTLVIFTSDNGPWLLFDDHGGSAGLLHDGKGTTWEGGMRVPGIFYWPGKIAPARIDEIGSTLDIWATASALAGLEMPDDRIMDGYDLSPVLFNNEPSPRDNVLYYRGTTLYAARKGAYKLHYITETCYTNDNNRIDHEQPLLFNLYEDPSEKYNIAEDFPEIIDEIDNMVKAHISGFKPVPDRLVLRDIKLN